MTLFSNSALSPLLTCSESSTAPEFWSAPQRGVSRAGQITRYRHCGHGWQTAAGNNPASEQQWDKHPFSAPPVTLIIAKTLHLFKQVWYHSKPPSINRNIYMTFQVSESEELPEFTVQCSNNRVSDICAVLYKALIKSVQIQDYRQNGEYQGENFPLLLNQAIGWRFKIVLRDTNILHCIIWKHVIYFECTFLRFLVSFKWIKTGVVRYFSREGKHFRRQAFWQKKRWHLALSIDLLMTS